MPPRSHKIFCTLRQANCNLICVIALPSLRKHVCLFRPQKRTEKARSKSIFAILRLLVVLALTTCCLHAVYPQSKNGIFLADNVPAPTFLSGSSGDTNLSESPANHDFSATPLLLAAPTLLGPSNGVTGISIRPTFSWSSVTGANRYWLMVATSTSIFPTDPAATSCPSCIISGNTDALSYTVPNSFPFGFHTATLSPGTVYFWKVQAWNTNGTQGVYPSAFVFTTAAAAAPTISSVSPNPVTGSTSAQTVTINGANFVNKPTVFVTWTGGSSTLSSGQVTFVSSTQLRMSINVQNDPDTWTVRVTNPNGQASNTFGFTVVAPTPIVSSLTTSPSPPTTAGSFIFTINGSNFFPAGALIQVTGPGCAPCTIPNSVLTTKTTTTLVGPATLTTAGTYSFVVQNGFLAQTGGPGPRSSGTNVTVTSGTVAPTISSVSPNPVTGSTSAQTVTINGANFVDKPTVFVTWTGGSSTLSSGQVTFVSSTQLRMSINVQNDPDTWTVRVTNPNGQGSNTFGFTVVASTTSADAATFVSETILDGTAIAAGQPFTKSWTIRNSGTTTWNSNYKLRWVSGANLSNHADVVIAGTVPPGSIYTFIVPMTAPSSQGTYREDWKFIGPTATTIRISNSNTIWVSMRVADSSVVDKADFISETFVDGTTVPAGQSFTKSWTIRNSGSSTWNSNYRLRWVSGTNLSSHADVQVSGTIPPGTNYTFNIPMTALNATGTYREDWKFINASGLTIPISASSTVWVSIRVNAGGQSSITGSVTSSAGGPIAGAEVRIGSNITQTNSQGVYSISSIAAGDYSVTVSKTGFTTFSGPLSIPASTQAHKDFTLQTSVATTAITISSITTKYRGKTYYLDGISQNVTFTANIEWGGHSPAKVLFITPKGLYEVLTNSGVASKTLDVGNEFGKCGTLKVRAVSSDGASSAEKIADFVVMSKVLTGLTPAVDSFIRFVDLGDNFHYEFTAGTDLRFFDELIDGGAIPEDFPIFGRKGFGLRFIPTVTTEISNNGEATYELAFNNKRNPLFQFLGRDFELEPLFELNGTFSDTSCNWNWGGHIGVKGSFELEGPSFRPPPPFTFLYIKPAGRVSIDALGGFASFAPSGPTPNLKLDIDPELNLSLGAGADMFLAAAVTGTAGAELQFQWPETPHLKDATFFVSAKVGIYGLLHIEQEVFRCDYSVITRIGGCTAGASSSIASQFNLASDPIRFRAVPRDYINVPDYGKFQANRILEIRQSIASQSQSNRNITTTIQSTVFPYSEPNASANGNSLYLAWIYDDPERSAINRAVAVFSNWDGQAWTEPQAIAGDGTADFHPQLLTFSDGSAMAAWEDVKTALPETASFNDLVDHLEVSTSFYDPKSNRWSPAVRMTTNSHLDRSPRLAGQSSDNALLVWTSNEQNDLAGSVSKPNTLWSAKWNGTAWTAAQSVASVPQGLLKYDLTYNGSKGTLILSLDSDSDRSTNEDHELYAIKYENGSWGNLTRLTNDNVTDDNPRLATDSKGNQILVWMKGDEIYSAANGDIDGRKLVARPGYSTNVADFKLAHTLEGRIALIWAESNAQFSSDVQALFYDPALDLWGSKSQLTADQELESNIAAAFYSDKLIAIYDRTLPPQTNDQTSKPALQQTAIPTPGTTDLYMLTHIIGGDLAIKSNTLEASPGNPRPGEVTALSATILNQGDIGARDVPVSFYQGNPNDSGTLIGTTLVSTTLAPGAEQRVAIPWTPTSTTSPFSIYVVVDPNQAFSDNNRTNNVASKPVIRADLAIQSIRWERHTATSVVVIARIVNLGSLPTLPTSVSFIRDSATGALLSSPAIGVLNPDQSFDVAIQWDTTGLTAPEYTLYLVADPNNSVDEYDKANNVATLVVSLKENVAPIQLLLEQSGSDQLPALDSVLFLRDPFPVVNGFNLLNQGSDRNTRLIVFLMNLQLAQSDSSSAVVVNLVDSNNQSYDVVAEDVRRLADVNFTQVVFRLPNNLPAGVCTIKVHALGQVSNSGTIRIRP